MLVSNCFSTASNRLTLFFLEEIEKDSQEEDEVLPLPVDDDEEEASIESLMEEEREAYRSMDLEIFTRRFINMDALKKESPNLNLELAANTFKTILGFEDQVQKAFCDPYNEESIKTASMRWTGVTGKLPKPSIVLASGSGLKKRRASGRTGDSPKQKKTKKTRKGKGRVISHDSEEDVEMEKTSTESEDED